MPDIQAAQVTVERIHFFKGDIDQKNYNGITIGTREVLRRSDEDDANLISSETTTGLHAPVIDLDFPCRLIPSSNEGHYHLYIDKEITWEQYERLLIGLYDAGLIQKAWFENARADRRSYVRRLGVYKPDSLVAQLQERIEALELENLRLQGELIKTQHVGMTWG